MSKASNIDSKLIEKVLEQGDKSSFDILVVKYQNKIASVVTIFIKDYQEVENLTQEIFLKAYLHLKSFKGNSSFYTWLYRIAINTAKSYLITKNRVKSIDIDDQDEVPESVFLEKVFSPLEMLNENKLQKIIQDTISNMPLKLKMSFIFREFYGMSYNDIANILDCPLGTIRSRLFRAREILDEQIGKYLNP